MRSLGPREREALALVQQRPGLTVEELADALGVRTKRMWGMLSRLEATVCGGGEHRVKASTRPLLDG